MSHKKSNKDIQKGWLEKPRTLRMLWILLYATCALTVILELFISRKPHFGFDGFFGFYALLGFISCALLILIAKFGGIFLKRKENYYQED